MGQDPLTPTIPTPKPRRQGFRNYLFPRADTPGSRKTTLKLYYIPLGPWLHQLTFSLVFPVRSRRRLSRPLPVLPSNPRVPQLFIISEPASQNISTFSLWDPPLSAREDPSLSLENPRRR